MPLRLCIDIACRAAHQISLADEQGRFYLGRPPVSHYAAGSGRLWSMLPEGTDPAEVMVVMEPTRNA